MWDDGAAVDAHHAWSLGGGGGLFLILVLFALTAAAAAMLATSLARRDELVRRAISRRAIFEKVEKALKEARTVSGPDQVSAAQKVMNIIGEHLNPAFMLAGGVNDPAGRLRKALGGKTTEPVHGAEQPGVQVPVSGGSAPIVVITSNSGPALAPATASAAASSGGGGASVSVTGGGQDVGLVAAPQIYALKPIAAAVKEPEKPVERDMSWRERQDAVQRSLDDLAAFWKRDNVEALLINAQKALCDVKLPPRPPGR
jgi:hypothetical protein